MPNFWPPKKHPEGHGGMVGKIDNSDKLETSNTQVWYGTWYTSIVILLWGHNGGQWRLIG